LFVLRYGLRDISGQPLYEGQLAIIQKWADGSRETAAVPGNRPVITQSDAPGSTVQAAPLGLTSIHLTYILVGMLKAPDRKPRLRDSQRTRERLLQAAFREVYRYGFQSAGIDTILAATNVTKGALYYHFESKEALGYAIVEEVIAKLTSDRWMIPLQQSEDKDPIDALIGVVKAIPHGPRDVKCGCPLVNLTQEMSQLDEQFRKRLERIFCAWQKEIATVLRRGQSQEVVRRNLVPEEAASFLIAMVEGYEVLAKNAQDTKVWDVGIRNIVSWLNSLRAPGNRKRG
jgi:TetR/AcrR family transcriptional regulator, transcriptional repressor for nem operon